MLFPVTANKHGSRKKQQLLFKMNLKKIVIGVVVFIGTAPFCLAQLTWVNVDSLYAPLPPSVHVYKTTDSIDGKANIAFYVIADLKDRKLNFTTDTTHQRRLTPQQFHIKNNQPLVVVNGTFFDFASNKNLNVVVKDGKMVSYNIHTIAGRGKDTLTYFHPLRSALGITKKRRADIAWLYADTGKRKYPVAFQRDPILIQDSVKWISVYHYSPHMRHLPKNEKWYWVDNVWKVRTAIGGGPVLIHKNQIRITNNEERMFMGKAIDDRHPRTAMGYTRDQKLIILVVQGRFPGVAEGASLNHLAEMLLNLGCTEALNLDGGGSSCMLINGKETIQPSDKTGQRAVPAVFVIEKRKK
jgi:exopolysaccharide biosynthesis protein